MAERGRGCKLHLSLTCEARKIFLYKLSSSLQTRPRGSHLFSLCMHLTPIYQFCIIPIECHEFFMISSFDNFPMIYKENYVGVSNSRKSVCNNKTCAPLQKFIQTFLQSLFCLSVYAGSCFIQNQNARV